MSTTELQAIAGSVLRRAREHGYVVPKDIRAALTEAALPNDSWRDVVALLDGSLAYRRGRYYYLTADSPRRQQDDEQQRRLQEVIGQLVARPTENVNTERRQELRHTVTMTVTVVANDGTTFTAQCRELSPTGMRLLSGQGLTGRKLHIRFATDGEDVVITARVLWTTAVADGVYENGCRFLEVIS